MNTMLAFGHYSGHEARGLALVILTGIIIAGIFLLNDKSGGQNEKE